MSDAGPGRARAAAGPMERRSRCSTRARSATSTAGMMTCCCSSPRTGCPPTTTCCRTPIPDKGKILTQLSLWWFGQLADLVPNHLVDAEIPAEFAGRAMACRRLSMVPVECVARGYLAGSGLREYRAVRVRVRRAAAPRAHRRVPAARADLHPGDQGAARAARREHPAVRGGRARSARTSPLSWSGSRWRCTGGGRPSPPGSGILVADTKIELGFDPGGRLLLADEVLTPDSSRLWPASQWQPGRPQVSFDKQIVRDWLDSPEAGWDKRDTGRPQHCPATWSSRPAQATSRHMSASLDDSGYDCRDSLATRLRAADWARSG